MVRTITEQLGELDKIKDGETKIICGFVVRTADGEFLDVDDELGSFAPEYVTLHETYSDADNAGEDAAGETEDGFEYTVLALSITLAPATAELKTGADIVGAAIAGIRAE